MPKTQWDAENKIRWDADYDHKKDLFTYSKVQDVTDYVEANLEEQVNGLNGWTPQRTMRKIGSIPPAAFFQWYIKNKIADMPHIDKQAALIRFLNENPQYRTVDKMKHDTANQGHIIIK